VAAGVTTYRRGGCTGGVEIEIGGKNHAEEMEEMIPPRLWYIQQQQQCTAYGAQQKTAVQYVKQHNSRTIYNSEYNKTAGSSSTAV
jgi:hypothetical protein